MYYNKFIRFAGIAIFMALQLISCSKDMNPAINGGETVQKASVILRINNVTKATGALHTSQADDNFINNIAIFVFRKDAAKTLETYKYVRVTDQSMLNGITFETTTGNKNIFVIANSHDSTQWTGIVSETQFLLKEANLKNEKLKDFTMSGRLDNAAITQSNSFNLILKRVVSKIVLNSLRTDFVGTPFQGMQLSNVKVYLTNVHKIRPYIENGTTTNPFIINPLQNTPSTYSDCQITGIVYDVPGVSINDTPYNTKHHFYAYENSISQESASEKFTKLVIEASLNGTTYYYPVDINREGYGGTTNNGINRNTVYNLSIIIKRPGSTSPDQMVEKGTIVTSVTIADWDSENLGNVEF